MQRVKNITFLIIYFNLSSIQIFRPFSFALISLLLLHCPPQKRDSHSRKVARNMPTTVKTKTSSLQNFASGLAISEGTKDCLKETKLPGDTSAGVFPRWKAFIPLQQGDEWCSCPELTRSNTNNPAAGQCLQIEPLDFIASRDEPLEARSPPAPRPLVPIRSQWFARPVCYYIRSLTRPSCE